MKAKLFVALIALSAFIGGLAYAGKISNSPDANCASCDTCTSCSSSCQESCSE